MARRIVTNNGVLYTISPDNDVPLAARTQAIVSGLLVDEITGQTPGGAVTIRAVEPGFQPRVAADGLVGLTGIPISRFPQLATQNYVINVTIEVEGYVELRQPVPILQDAGFPDSFTPGDMKTLLLHRDPVVISGRVVAISGHKTVPIPLASVQITGVWRTFPPSDVTAPAPDPPDLVSLCPPLYAPRKAGGTGDVLRRRDVVPVVGQDKHLLATAAAGEQTLNLSDRVNIAPGDLLMLDALNPDLVEYVTIATVSGASTADQPAVVELAYPLAYEHKGNALVYKVTLQPPGLDNALAVDAISGDTCVFLQSMNSLNAISNVLTQNVVEITDGTHTEYHSVRLFFVKSDSNGYFRLPPLSRVAQVDIQAVRGTGSPSTIPFSPDYYSYENRIDFIFS